MLRAEGPPGFAAADPLRPIAASGMSGTLLLVIACAVAGTAASVAALAGLALALLGVFSPSAVAVIATLAAVAVGARLYDGEAVLVDRPAAVLLLLAACSTGMNAKFTSEHVLTDRDPGVYLNVAISLAAQGSLVLDPEEDRFGGAAVDFSSQGFEHYPEDDLVRPQFFHGFPALVAVLDGLFGHRVAVRAPAMLGGITIMAFGLVLRRLVPPWSATLGAGALGGLVIQFWIGRGTYSEALAQPLLWLSLLFLSCAVGRLDAAQHDRRQLHAFAVAAGSCMAALAVTRAEAPLLVPVVVASGWLLRRRGADVAALAAVVGLPMVGLLLWLVDLLLVSRPYWYLADELVRLTAASAAGGLLLAVGLGVVSRPRAVRAIERHRRLAAIAAGWFVPVVAALGLLRALLTVDVRHRPDGAMRMIEAANGLPPEGLRTYAEQSMVWQAWYLGWPAFLLAVIGLAFLAHGSVLVPARAQLGLLAVATVPMTLLYLWRPSAYPDHLWVMRRYIVAALPLLVVGMTVACASLPSRLQNRSGRRAAAAAAWLALFAGLASTSVPLLRLNPYDGHLVLMTNICDALPRDAVVLVDTAQSLHLVIQAPIRSFCRVPSAAVKDSSPRSIDAAADDIRRAGGQPVLLSADPSMAPAGPPAETFVVINERYQGFMLTKPTSLTRHSVSVVVIPL